TTIEDTTEGDDNTPNDQYRFDNTNDDGNNNGISSTLNNNLTRTIKRKRNLNATLITVDEEKEMNKTTSKFKSICDEIYEQCYYNNGNLLDTRTTTRKANNGNIKWLNYLKTSFMPSVPVWSSLLLGDLGRYKKQLNNSDSLSLQKSHPQRTNNNSERRMGYEIRERLDIVLSILVPDMVNTIELFHTGLSKSAIVIESVQFEEDEQQQQRLKPVEDPWRKKLDKRGRGFYSQKPNDYILSRITSNLTNPPIVNDFLSLPLLSTPEWLTCTITLLLSIKNIRQQKLSQQIYPSALLNEICQFIDYCSSIRNQKNENSKIKKRKVATENTIATTQFSISQDFISNDVNEQIEIIVKQILVPVMETRIEGVNLYE
ncbi:unnamed protein product, partial [Didymodactylos carnosus]